MDARRITAAVGVATGGLVAAGLLSAAAALADEIFVCTDGPCPVGAAATTSDYPGVPGHDAFTLGGITYDPITTDTAPANPGSLVQPTSTIVEGWNATNGHPELLANPQDFVLYSATDSTPTPLAIAESQAYTESFFGVHNTAFLLTNVAPDPGGLSATDAAQVPTSGTFYDVLNFGSGFENVYRDILGTDGASNSITDEFATPFGDFNIPTTVDYFDLNPGDAFTGIG